MQMNQEQTIGELASTYPASVRVFQRRGLDFCCGGKQPLVQACEKRGLDAGAILEEIRQEVAQANAPEIDWAERPLTEIIDHLLETYHQPLYEELPRLERMAAKVRVVHGDKDPVRFAALLRLVTEIKEELEPHMMKEERVLFPAIRQGMGQGMSMPVRVMESDHVTTGAQLEQLRELTSNYQAPPGACATWRALWNGLAELDAGLQRHIHLENNILFPRALAG